MELTDFLLARIAEDEAVARTASPGPWRIAIDKQWHSRPYVTDAEDRPVLDGAAEFAADQWLDATDEDLAHIVRWHPARVRAECDAKRQIIRLHESWPVLVEQQPELAAPVAGLNDLTFRMTQQIAWATQEEYRKRFGEEPPTTPMLRALALPYADHPDWRQEWKP